MNLFVVLERDFFLENVYWIAALVALAFVIGFFLIDGIFGRYQLAKERRMRDEKVYIKALGGEGNVLWKELEGSRIIVSLQDYDLLDKDKLHDYGVSGFLKMSDRLVMVVKKDPEEIYFKLFGSRP